jgi:hypothetical protein
VKSSRSRTISALLNEWQGAAMMKKSTARGAGPNIAITLTIKL